MVLSVGTGCQKPVSHELGPYRGIWLDGFIPRILRAFLSSPSLDAESSWMALWNRLDANTRERYHRLSCEFAGELPDLDDSSQIPRLIHMTKGSTVDYDALKCKLWASRFFFELRSRPQRVHGYYICQGTILCRSRDCRPVIEAICRCFDLPKIVMENKPIIDLTDGTCFCERCGYFQKEVAFEVSHLGHAASLCLEFDDSRQSPLASFPKPMAWFLARQLRHGKLFQWKPRSPCCARRPKMERASSSRGNAKRRKLA